MGRQKHEKFIKAMGLWYKALITKYLFMHLYFWDGCPISGYGLHSFPTYRSKLEESFDEAPDISLYGCLT
jgi:hypothetical protein